MPFAVSLWHKSLVKFSFQESDQGQVQLMIRCHIPGLEPDEINCLKYCFDLFDSKKQDLLSAWTRSWGPWGSVPARRSWRISWPRSTRRASWPSSNNCALSSLWRTLMMERISTSTISDYVRVQTASPQWLRQTGGGFQEIKINQTLRSLNEQKIENYKTLSECA